MKSSRPWTFALGAAIGFGLAAIIDFVVWTTAHQKDLLYVAVIFAVAALLWVGVSVKLRTRET
jgi:predicted membrane channel-forming protein YqfA (hemolysin III family)